MLRLTPGMPVYLAAGPTDLRNNIDGLSIIVQQKFCLDPFSPALFVFCNRAKDKVKILFWDKNGFWLYYKRLERGRFKWPKMVDKARTIEVTEQQLSWILDGLNMEEKRAFKEVMERKII